MVLTFFIVVGSCEHNQSLNMLQLILLLLQIHPSELKPAVTDALNAILQPVRDHFAKGDAKKLLDTVRKFKVTR